MKRTLESLYRIVSFQKYDKYRMHFNEIENRPKLIKLHYFSVDDDQTAQELGLKQDRNHQWFLPQYNTSGSKFDRIATTAIRIFGRPRTVNLK